MKITNHKTSIQRKSTRSKMDAQFYEKKSPYNEKGRNDK